MKLQFDAQQSYQLDAINSITDLFDGQPIHKSDFEITLQTQQDWGLAGQTQMEMGLGNRLVLNQEEIFKNLLKIQEKNDLPLDKKLIPAIDGDSSSCPLNFSVEMETGTGKTYVYLRTFLELNRKFGFRKFIIVVPSVAIREGILKTLEITKEHFGAIFKNVEYEYFNYDSKKLGRLRQFAISNQIQIMVINIDAFRRNFTDADSKGKSNIIYQERDQLPGGLPPIEYVRSVNPIVVIDEPQSVDNTEKAQEAIKALNPLLILRYSATHRNLYNLVYRLDPVKAFSLGLVKQIVVASAKATSGIPDAFVRVEKVDYKNEIKAKLKVFEQTNDGPKEKSITVKSGSDLFILTKENENYRNGYTITEIHGEPGNEFIRFNDGRVLRLGEEIGGLRDDIWKIQIRETIKQHLEKELRLKGRGIKVLSLFFIDRVANYRDYDESGSPVMGKFALEFDELFKELLKDKRYKDLTWVKEPIDRIRNGYFAQDKKCVYKDTRGDSQADDDAYNLIMKDKEKLLSMEEPLRFIFSHSALREGWDNPNVFQICTLSQARSNIKKRQEIGRGLRLPVNQEGIRVFDEFENKLYVMANESYEEFAKALQTEYAEDCGVIFGKVPITAFSKLMTIIDGEEKPIGLISAEKIKKALVEQKMIAEDGLILQAFDPQRTGFKIDLPKELAVLTSDVIDLLSSYRIEKHIKRDKDEKVNKLKKEVTLSPEFRTLWDKIKTRTTYRVEFETDKLISKAIDGIKKMAHINPVRVQVLTGAVGVTKAGVVASAVGSSIENITIDKPNIPDILAYLQNETELTRSTLVKILKGSDRLTEFIANPQVFMDQVAHILKYELHRLMIEGIKYEKISGDPPEAVWEMKLFQDDELVNYLTALQVKKSIYDYVVYDSEIEREFAKKLDERADIKLFVKLPRWFEVETPVGKYNPDWAIIKQDGNVLYLVRETKSTKDFLKLRTSEADKVNCGFKHFEAIGVSFDVAVSADDV